MIGGLEAGIEIVYAINQLQKICCFFLSFVWLIPSKWMATFKMGNWLFSTSLSGKAFREFLIQIQILFRHKPIMFTQNTI